MTEFFQGAEFDWLRRQVQGVLWAAGQPLRGTPKHLEVIWGAVNYKPKAFLEVPAGSLPNQMYLSVAPDSVRPMTSKTLAKPAESLSVEEYNAWRGGHPARAAAVPYVYQAYPMVLYKGTDTKVVDNAKEHAVSLKQGWKEGGPS